ncbi:sensor domain-containing diguanylate cyclase [Deinococcus hopiensis]|uniref:Diguanylate cyclase (GGDEF) domain-containing protein n=1 Tax=Deinococcus hopiensis KR-140 TaxID=695939 RepID=A0A1W1UKC5_9DEIO|nr:diguanylate cyclase [Deinococcus hopiensis]SMB81530.1 diguanylate cyclase (GGDEF) domain-containing protein [Deinococcus hopiensis KR-140]
MSSAPLPSDEYARLMDLAHYEVLDTPREEAFDRITRLAARLLNTPVAVINFVDQFRQWGKSATGLGDTTAPRTDSFCAWTILQDVPLVIEDTGADSRFRHNPMVTGAPHIHMYAGAPLKTPAGHNIGTLCVTDDRPHPLSEEDQRALQDLADLVVSELELRAQNLRLSRELEAETRRRQDMQHTLDQARTLEGVSSLMDLDLEPEEVTLAASALLGEALPVDYMGLLLFEEDDLEIKVAYLHPRLPPSALALSDRTQAPLWPASVTRTLRSITAPVYLDDYATHPGALPAFVAGGVKQIAWLPLGLRGGVTTLLMAVRLQDHPVAQWRGSDRSLLEAAGRSVRSSLDRHSVVQTAQQEARRDVLTGLLNRRAFEEDLARWEGGVKRFTLALMDLDGLKTVNDLEGHEQGDKMLRVFASALGAALGSGASAYRLGGDEFVVLGELEEETLLEAVDTAVLAGQQVAQLRGASVGFVQGGEAQGQALVALADKRMYGVKRRRKALRAEPEDVRR